MSVDILQLAKEAAAKKQTNPNVINATIGMYYDEEGRIGGMPSVFKGLKALNEDQVLPYPAADGGEPFKSNVISWVLGQYEDKLRKDLYISACATPGGSGAITQTFDLYGKPGNKVFISDVRWQYDRFASRAHLSIFDHNTFVDGHFDIDSFQSRLAALCEIQKQVIVIINDPCHNPTGYILSMCEWKKILSILNQFKDNDIVFLYDIAYLEFTNEEDSRLKLSYLNVLEDHVITIVSFSGSKTYGVYGVRLGAAIAISKNEQKILDYQKNAVAHARGSWSSTPTPAIELLNYFSLEEHQNDFLKDLEHIKTSVKARSDLFKSQAEENHLLTHPFESGFYTIVLAEDPDLAFKKLLDQDIYTIPMAGGIRLSLCSLPLKEIDGLAGRIKEILK